jgi:hypothetical protein
MFIENENFKSYLAGLLEGDGSFVVPSNLRDTKNRLQYAKIKVAFHIDDKPLAECLRLYYGGHFEEHEHFVVWTITKKDQILIICSDINGFLRTPKIHNFSRLIAFLKKQDSSIDFEVLPLDESPIGSNAWLSGFSDADSNFNLNIHERKNGQKRVQLFFRIEVKEFFDRHLIVNSKNCSTFTPICNTIAELFNLGVYHRVRENKYYSIIISTTSVNTNAKVVEYFEKYPLFSSKHLNFLGWKKIHEMQEKKQHLTLKGFKICENIKKNYNRNRKTFLWNHLNNFYLKVNEK